MSVQLFLVNTATSLGSSKLALSTTRGGASTSAITATSASGTNIPVTSTSGGTAISWWYQVGAGTISGNVTANIRGSESDTSANAGAGIDIDLYQSDGITFIGNLLTITVPSTITEYSTTDATEALASNALVSQIATNGCWINVTLAVRNVGTMASGYTVTNTYNGATLGSAGDTYVTFVTSLPVYVAPTAGVPYIASVGVPTNGVSGLSVPVPQGVVVGDLIVLALGAEWNSTTLPDATSLSVSGFTVAQVAAFQSYTNYAETNFLLYKYATAADTGNYTVTFSTVNGGMVDLTAGVASIVRGGPSSGNPFTDTFQSSHSVGSATVSVSTFTPTAGNTLLFGSTWWNDTTATSSTYPSGWVEQANVSSGTAIMLSTLQQTTATTTGTLTWGSSTGTPDPVVLIGSIRTPVITFPANNLLNTFEGGTNNTAITSANSGTNSGDPIFSTANNAGTTLQFSNDFAHRGALSLRVSFAASSAGYAIWNFVPSVINARTVVSCYIYLPSTSNVLLTDILVIRSASNNVANLSVGGSGSLSLRAGSTQTIVWNSSTALPRDKWVQVMIAVTVGTTTSNGVIEGAYYLNDSLTATESSGVLTGNNLGTVTMSTIRLGYSGTVGTAARNVYYDDFQCQELIAGYINPIVGPLTIAGTADQPTISSGALAASALHSTIIGIGSVGYMREKRTGVTETAAGVSQTSTATLDLTGSTHYRYPGMHGDYLAPTSSNPGQYMGSVFKPGASVTVQNARYLFTVEFVTNSPLISIRLNAVVANSRLGRVYVNGKPLSKSAVNFTATAGAGTEVVMNFPAAASRTILIIGFNNDEGRFGGVDVPVGYSVTTPTAPISDLLMYLGDSYMNGAGSNVTAGANDVETWIWAVADSLGITHVMTDAMGGTGYVTDTGGLTNRFSSRVPDIAKTNPTIMILGGGRNDSSGTGVQAAAEALIDAANSAGVAKIYLTNSADDAQTATIAAVRMACATRAKKYVGGFSISVLPKIADNIHMTQAGHATFAANTAAFILSPTRNFKVGSSNPSALAINALDVAQIRLGSNLVWEK